MKKKNSRFMKFKPQSSSVSAVRRIRNCVWACNGPINLCHTHLTTNLEALHRCELLRRWSPS